MTWLKTRLTADIDVSPRWPAEGEILPPKAVTVILAGNRRDMAWEPRIIAAQNDGSVGSTIRAQVVACEQSFQLDIWATSDVERDDILAQLDDALRWDSTPLDGIADWSNGLLLRLTDGWEDTFADLSFDGVDNTDTPDSVMRFEYRSTIRADASFILSVTRSVARQTAIVIQQRFALTDAYDSTTIGP